MPAPEIKSFLEVATLFVVCWTRQEVLQVCFGTPANSTFDFLVVVFEPLLLSSPLAG